MLLLVWKYEWSPLFLLLWRQGFHLTTSTHVTFPCLLDKNTPWDSDRETCSTVRSNKGLVVHYQANGQREKSYNLVREGLCLYDPGASSLTNSLLHTRPAVWTLHCGPFLPTSCFHPSSLVFTWTWMAVDNGLIGINVSGLYIATQNINLTLLDKGWHEYTCTVVHTHTWASTCTQKASSMTETVIDPPQVSPSAHIYMNSNRAEERRG